MYPHSQCHLQWLEGQPQNVSDVPTQFSPTFTMELMDVSGLWDLNEKKVEELLYLLVFVRNPKSEE